MSVLLAPSSKVKVENLFATEKQTSENGLYVSLETYWQQYYEHGDVNYEWNNGRLEEKGVSQYITTKLYNWFLELLRHFLRVNQVGQIVNLETGFKLNLPTGQKVRIPDLGIVLNENPVPIRDEDRSYHGIFDLCIEAISDSTPKEKERDTLVKKKEYAQSKVPEYYILDGQGSEMGFYRLNKHREYEEINATKGGVIQSEVLPGFQFRIRDLYRLPTPKEMVTDPVYRGFIMLDYQAQKEKADFAMQRAYEEKQKADEQKLIAEEEKRKAEEEKRRADEVQNQLLLERQENERLIAKLKELGISLDEI